MHNGRRILDADAHVIEPPDVFGPAAAMTAIDIAPHTPMIPCGDPEKLRDQFAHGFDAPSYLRAMDAQGIDAVVLYPSTGLFVPFQPDLDGAASARACRAYNEWVAGYCEQGRGRMFAVGLAPLVDPRRATLEAAHAARLGLV